MSIAEYDAAITAAQENKAESLENPNGVRYFDQLWDAVKDKPGPLSVALRTDERLFSNIPVTAHWTHGRYNWEKDEAPERSNLLFVVPEEVTRRIQSRHASKILERFFGMSDHAILKHPFMGRQEAVIADIHNYDRSTKEVVTHDWATLKRAIGVTAADESGYLGGQAIRIAGPHGLSTVAARVQGLSLELYMDEKTVNAIENVWTATFRQSVQLEI